MEAKRLTTRASQTRPLYAALGLPDNASDAEIKASWISIARAHHPDVQGSDPVIFTAAREAFAVFSDPVRKAVYDSTGVDTLYGEEGRYTRRSAVSLVSKMVVDAIATGVDTTKENIVYWLRDQIGRQRREAAKRLRQLKANIQLVEKQVRELDERWQYPGDNILKRGVLNRLEETLKVDRGEAANLEQFPAVCEYALQLLKPATYRADVVIATDQTLWSALQGLQTTSGSNAGYVVDLHNLYNLGV